MHCPAEHQRTCVSIKYSELGQAIPVRLRGKQKASYCCLQVRAVQHRIACKKCFGLPSVDIHGIPKISIPYCGSSCSCSDLEHGRRRVIRRCLPKSVEANELPIVCDYLTITNFLSPASVDSCPNKSFVDFVLIELNYHLNVSVLCALPYSFMFLSIFKC